MTRTIFPSRYKDQPAITPESEAISAQFLPGVGAVRFPYRLEKWVSFAAETVLPLDYRLSNLSGFDLDFMWAAHMMVNLEEGAELKLPDCVRRIVTALSLDGGPGRCGDELDGPVEQAPYFAALPNEGGCQDLYRIFLEPATGSFDRPDVACLCEECSTVMANAMYEWHPDIRRS